MARPTAPVGLSCSFLACGRPFVKRQSILRQPTPTSTHKTFTTTTVTRLPNFTYPCDDQVLAYYKSQIFMNDPIKRIRKMGTRLSKAVEGSADVKEPGSSQGCTTLGGLTPARYDSVDRFTVDR
ncbi:hypothetical protein BR93DRAFT_164033 [Coniochaeta sp. PMI_546]|nr:hypothetical protein BR93DRAFT_164033 [Coniochaeta sp. PMI_546]